VSVGAALLSLLLVAAAPSFGSNRSPNRVSPHEFRSVHVGDPKGVVQKTWGTRGNLQYTYAAAGQTYRLKRYHTTEGYTTWVWATYEKTGLDDPAWRLTDKRWCIWDDPARTASATNTYTCHHHPW
jgi:hypothetical protein